jgi:phosphoglycolate phosphatase-like HAD superfamily hydrolase
MLAALGGPTRIEALRALFADLRGQGAVLTIVTLGYVGVVKTLLTEVGLLHHFDRVIGQIGNNYGVEEYDLLGHPQSNLEGNPTNELRVRKAAFVEAILQREGLSPSQAVLVEDDPNEAASVVHPGICGAVTVKDQSGMMAEEMDSLLSLARLEPGTPERGYAWGNSGTQTLAGVRS